MHDLERQMLNFVTKDEHTLSNRAMVSQANFDELRGSLHKLQTINITSDERNSKVMKEMKANFDDQMVNMQERID